MSKQDRVRHAMAAGHRQAARVLEWSAAARVRRREAAAARLERPFKLLKMTGPQGPQQPATLTGSPPPAPPPPAALQQAILVAEGDSWFDYPGPDILSFLKNEFGYDVRSVAERGHRIEAMAYDDGQLADLTELIDDLKQAGTPPHAILLSGGGNDIAVDDFGVLLNHIDSPTPGLNTDVVSGIIDDRIRHALITILTAVTDICAGLLPAPIPILIHGYDYPVPDGRGFLGGWWFLPGPWLEPGFRQKGYTLLSDRKLHAKALIDSLNAMLASVVLLPEFSHVKHVDVRGTLSNQPGDYKQWWDNELHPTPAGFKLVAAAIDNEL